MKKIFVVLVLLLVTPMLFSQEYGNFGIGANLGFNMQNEDNDSGTNNDKDTTFMFQLNLSFMLGESFELRPFLGGGFAKSETDGSQNDGDNFFGAGIGTYWHALKTDFFRMGPGVTLDGMYSSDSYPSSDTAWNMYMTMKIPIMMEFVMTKNFVFRMEYSMFLFSYAIMENNSNDMDYVYNVKLFPMDPSKMSSEFDFFMGTQIVKFGFDFRF